MTAQTHHPTPTPNKRDIELKACRTRIENQRRRIADLEAENERLRAEVAAMLDLRRKWK